MWGASEIELKLEFQIRVLQDYQVFANVRKE
jgi:hypothetical protein